MKKLSITLAFLMVLVLPVTVARSMVKYNPDIEANIADLQTRVGQLETANKTLQQKVDQLPTTGKTIETIVKDPDNTKVDALEKRVTVLESAVSFIQTKVMQAITTTIGLLQKLLAR